MLRRGKRVHPEKRRRETPGEKRELHHYRGFRSHGCVPLDMRAQLAKVGAAGKRSSRPAPRESKRLEENLETNAGVRPEFGMKPVCLKQGGEKRARGGGGGGGGGGGHAIANGAGVAANSRSTRIAQKKRQSLPKAEPRPRSPAKGGKGGATSSLKKIATQRNRQGEDKPSVEQRKNPLGQPMRRKSRKDADKKGGWGPLLGH